MALSPNCRIFYMKYSSHLQVNYNYHFKIVVFIGQYQLVFPGRCNINQPMSEVSINMLLKRIGYDGKATRHGFRHTMSTILHEKGFNSACIETQLAHRDKNSIRGTYNHAQYLERRREMMQWY